jgi:uncharacterized DUF497 family protein
MNMLRFDWDPEKARANLKKHGVSFEEARSVFFDECAVEFYDDEHAEWEDRFLLLGLSSQLNLLLVPLLSGSRRCHPYYLRAKSYKGGIRTLSEVLT